ncbi:DNA internalization-related competence protein ComEC/Rec2 [Staphylococcus kloosii]|uniref:DNA internalization-related competence protein ComEC/Rec2 n=1 Tax=Staphylococcus kloosii TaxID=29384 RepID=UPI0028A47665|nr:DNA internalization-related competence protein ComEC/Rec2 [Staphylococcus kloosii]MDT3959410.1 DNA internalization-related competence protein ComEC/Rec2 [Staphylococcus kloosii]
MLSIVLITPIISFAFFEKHFIQTLQQRTHILHNPKINQYVTFVAIHQPYENSIIGTLQIDNEKYRFFYYSNEPLNIDAINNHVCPIDGSYKPITSSVFRPLIINIKHIKSNECEPTQRTVLNAFNNHKYHLYNKFKSSGLQQYDKIIALLFGDVNLLPKKLLDDVKDIGIYHLMAVSGSHIMAIVAMIYCISIRLGLPIPFIKVAICVILPIYACYTDFAPSALRAITMVLIVTLLPRFLLYRALDVLGSTFIILSTIAPHLVYDIGFQFSFLITLFILLSAPLFIQHNKAISLVLLNVITFLGSFMINSMHFNQIQWISLFSNILFIPLYTFIFFPLAIFYLLYVYVPISFQSVPLIIDSIFKLHDNLVRIFIIFTKIRWFVPELNHLQVTLCLLMVFVILRIFVLRKFVQTVVLFVLFSLAITYLPRDYTAQLTMFDVGHGDSFLLKTTKNKTVMIDTGGKYVDKKRQYNGTLSKYKILPTLKKKGIKKIDYLIITHPHNDHMGELEFLCQDLTFTNVIINKQSFTQQQLEYINTLATIYDFKMIDFLSLNSIYLDQFFIEFLDATIPHSEDQNEQSIITLIKYRGYKLLFMGDATINNEQLLLAKYDLSNIDILKVGHHGSKTSSSEAFMQVTNPRISLISNGQNNRFHLPDTQVLNNLKIINSKVYDTAQHGQVTITLNKELKISTEK